ncbi:hypothetical protein HK101_000863 [Irineochytrium annulatum]|nr:hypothetical protein HK101_000863 [Irineochytrium annulatum]
MAARLALLTTPMRHDAALRASEPEASKEPAEYTAIAVLSPIGNATATGTVVIDQKADGSVTVTVNLKGLPPSTTHGIHFHQWGDVSDKTKGEAAGTHFNPHNTSHACPGVNGVTDEQTHAGDLGNVVADEKGNVAFVFESDKTGADLDLGQSASAVVGHAVILHAGADDCKTQPTGASGARLAQGVVGWKNATAIPSFANSLQLKDGPAPHAIAVLAPTVNSTVSGMAHFVQQDDFVLIHCRFEGLAPDSTHGLHVHAFGDISAINGDSAGPHFNPFKANHSCPIEGEQDSDSSHSGDLGNFSVESDGTAEFVISTNAFTIENSFSPTYILGRALIVHADQDDCVSQPVGKAGARLAVGVIGLRNGTLDDMIPGLFATGGKGSSFQDPSSEDPSSHDPSSHDPSSHDPSSEDPSSHDPSSHDPSSEDPSSHDPSSEDPWSHEGGHGQPGHFEAAPQGGSPGGYGPGWSQNGRKGRKGRTQRKQRVQWN